MKLTRPIPFCLTAAATAALMAAGGLYTSAPPAQRAAMKPTLIAGTAAPPLPAPEPLRLQPGAPFAGQMQAFLFTSDSSEPDPAKVAGLLAALEKLTPAELAAASDDALAGANEARGSEMLQLLLGIWIEKEPHAAAAFVFDKYPAALPLVCRHLPAEAVKRFEAATGWSPGEAALEHTGALRPPWENIRILLAAERKLPPNSRTAAAAARTVQALQEAAAGLRDPNPAMQAQSREAGSTTLQRLQFTDPPAEVFVAEATFLSTMHPTRKAPAAYPGGDALQSGIAIHSDLFVNPRLAEAIAQQLSPVWQRESGALLKVLHSIPTVEERDAVALTIAECMGCTPFNADEKLTILKEIHSRWQELPIVTSLFHHASNETQASILAGLPSGPVRDEVILNQSITRFQTAPGEGLTQALSATQAPSHKWQMKQMLREWSDAQPAEAAAWLQAHPEAANLTLSP